MSEQPSGDEQQIAADPRLQERFDQALLRLEEAGRFNKGRYQHGVLDIARRLLPAAGGLDYLYEQAPRMNQAGLFVDTDWADPAALLPSLVRHTFEKGTRNIVVLECLNQLRMLSIARGSFIETGFTAEQARHFLTQVLALNLNRLFSNADEVARVRSDEFSQVVDALLQFHLSHIGFDDILTRLIDEIWRILSQRPIQVGAVRAMVTQIAVTLSERAIDLGDARLGADRLISALYGPTQGCADDPGIPAYQARLQSMDRPALEQEAFGFARAMHDVGLVSDYHPVFVRWLLEHDQTPLIASALGLSSTGLDVLRSYESLVHELISQAFYPQTAQSVYGLSMMLERGILYMPSVAPGLWRQLGVLLADSVKTRIAAAYGVDLAPRVHLLAGVISLMGQPLGIGQGNNPTCQSARALSMWSFSDPNYLLHLVAQVAYFDAVLMHFEGQPIDSSQLTGGSLLSPPLDTDAVSVLMVPHLDLIYHEMGRRCIGRNEDPHRWVNPELHGWWVGRKFMIAVDVASGKLKDYEQFLNQFYVTYHPFYNGNQPVIYPQPAGVAITDSTGAFVGWHAITILRVALDQDDCMRVYFYNPNNDSGQDWGHGVVVSTHGCGERFGEASLPFDQMLSRLYIYHQDPVLSEATVDVPAETLQGVREQAVASWAALRLPAGPAQAADPGPG